MFFRQRQQQQLATTNPPIATQCFMLTNMFEPDSETEPGWDQEIRDDVIDECNKYGGVLHIYVDKSAPQGNVYVKCPTVNTAVSAVNALHGRWFAGNNFLHVLKERKMMVESFKKRSLLTMGGTIHRYFPKKEKINYSSFCLFIQLSKKKKKIEASDWLFSRVNQ